MDLLLLKAELILLSLLRSSTNLKAEQAESSQDEEEKLCPPEAASKTAERGIYLYEKYGGTQKFRIPQLLAQASPISSRDIYEILDYFENNEFDRTTAGWGYEKEPSIDWICWLLMGGDHAWTWAKIVKRLRTTKIEIPK
jgi:hypothetical protein